MKSDTTTKLLKNVDRDVWRQFRALCVAKGITMGPSISALMIGALTGRIKLQENEGVLAKSKPGSWHWPDDREEGVL